MPTTLKIKVTKEVLEASKNCGFTNNDDSPEIQENCAIAIAVRDIFPGSQVEETEIFLSRDDWDKRYRNGGQIKLPKKATDFIMDFDALDPEDRMQMPEIEFEVSIPDEVIEKINIDEIRPLLLNHPTLELIEEQVG